MSAGARLSREVHGVVYAEFLIAFVPFFLLFLATAQLAFIASARIVVKHAAVMAARAAVLVIDDDPYFDETSSTRRKRLASAKQGTEPGGQAALLSYAGVPSSGREEKPKQGCDRLKRVRQAAYVPLSVLAPPPAQLARLVPGESAISQLLGSGARSLEGAIGTSPWVRVAGGLTLYNRFGAALTFPEQPGSRQLRELGGEGAPFTDDEVVTVRVTYLFGCHVPLARDVLCRWLRTDAELGELRHAEWATLQKPLLTLSGERFVVLEAEASMPNQGAAYDYASELCKTEKKLAQCRGKS